MCNVNDLALAAQYGRSVHGCYGSCTGWPLAKRRNLKKDVNVRVMLRCRAALQSHADSCDISVFWVNISYKLIVLRENLR